MSITRTFKGNRKNIELSGVKLVKKMTLRGIEEGSDLSKVKLLRKWPRGELKKVRVTGVSTY